MGKQSKHLKKKTKTELGKELADREKKLQQKDYELQIEAALEKVRITALSMKRPADMVGICHTISDQLELLDVAEIRNIQTAIFYPQKGTYFNYEFYRLHDKSFETEVEYANHPMQKEFADQMLGGAGGFFTKSLKGKKLKDWYAFQKTTNQFADTHLEIASSLNYYWYSLGAVALGISTYSPLTKKETGLFKRFRNVFELAYRRYLDIEKAEMQAREAQIQLALERVRARTMAMQKSDELLEVIQVLSQQFILLNFNIGAATFALNYKESNDFDLWLAVPVSSSVSKIHVPYFDHPLFNNFINAKEQGADFLTQQLSFEEKNSYFKHFFENAPGSSEEEMKWVYNSKGYAGSEVLMTSISLGIANIDAIPYTEEENAILKRFAAAFEQAYTRILDLQKAEAQVRESQIQLALERVRAKTMAMQKPSEFVDVINVMGEQFIDLGFDFDWVNFSANGHDVSKAIDIWNFVIVPGVYRGATRLVIPFFDHPVFSKAVDSVNEYNVSGNDFTIVLLDKKDKDSFLDHLFTNTIYKDLPDDVKTSQYDREVYLTSNVVLKDTWLSIGKYDAKTLTDEQIAILKRLANAFGQAYTRFLDLQKAETQAREAEIELALERVRARTMAMQKSEELAEAAQILYHEFGTLGFETFTCGYSFFKEESGLQTVWAVLPDGTLLRDFIDFPLRGDDVLNDRFNAWKEKQPLFICRLEKDASKKHHEFLSRHVPATVAENFFSNIPDPWFFYSANFSDGYLFIIAGKPFSQSEENTMVRFANVFEQTYTRFLDLQKAEAQAREAEIQLALERVRARSLAMHHTSELQEVVHILAQQLHHINIDINGGVFITINNEVGEDIPLWASAGAAEYAQKIVVPSWNKPIFTCLREAIKKGNNFLIEEYSEEEKIGFFSHLFNYAPWNTAPPERKQELLSKEGGYTRSVAISKHTSIAIINHYGKQFSDDDNEVLNRFGNVFEQSYTRFLDLQKAEAQAKEAQIQLALERVRARTMAMHNSDDVSAATATMFTELEKLGIENFRGGITNIRADRTQEVWSVNNLAEGKAVKAVGVFDMTAHPVWRSLYEGWERKAELNVGSLAGQEKQDYIKILNASPHYLQQPIREFPDLHFQAYYFGEGAVWCFSLQPHPDEHKQIMKRFASVFSLTFRRYKDLQKAEAQSREAQIEAALERVRSRTMAMQKSEELAETAEVLFQQFKILGKDLSRCFICFFRNEATQIEMWATTEDGKKIDKLFLITVNKHRIFQQVISEWKQNKEQFIIELQGEELLSYQQYLHDELDIPFSKDQKRRVMTAAFFTNGYVGMSSPDVPPGDIIQLLRRFASVFDLTYTRFLDLQKAEAQAREAKIEAALERVRAKAMAMHSSKDLSESISVFYRELKSLGVTPRRCGVALMDKEERLAEVTTMNTTEQGDSIEVIGHIKMSGHKILDDVYENWLVQKEYHTVLRGNEIKKYYQVLRPQVSYPDYSHDVVQYGYYFMFKEGDVYAWTENEMTDDELKIYRRFTTVISLTYKRYKDLQKAEAQAREARIEAALERVRAKAMAMHKTEDFNPAVAIVFEELEKLNLGVLRCGISVLNKEKRIGDVWLTSTTHQGQAVQVSGDEPFDIHPLLQGAFEAWLQQEDYYYVLRGDDLSAYYNAVRTARFQLPESQFVSSVNDETEQHCFVAVYHGGGLFAFQDTPFSDEAKKVMKRFASVFDLTYKRFLDLQKAEANAKEATIEAAMERVRARAMAMHTSNDLSATASMVFTELRKLGIKPIRCGVGLLNNESLKALLYSATSSPDGDSLSLVGWVMLSNHPVLDKIYTSWQNQEDYFPELTGEQLRSYYELLLDGLSVKIPDWKDGQVQYGNFLSFSIGCLYAWSDVPYNSEEIKILKRFAGIIDLTFRRYIELQQSEANAKEAIKQAALDRIRADIASMRTVSDLDRITPLIWNELTILGIPFIRCGVFIMDDWQRLIHTFLSTPEGRAIAAFHLPYDSPANIPEVVKHWRSNENYIIHWGLPEYTVMADTLVKIGAITTTEQYISSLPGEGFYLHFFPFLQGMLYVGNRSRLSDEEMKLIHSVAEAFSTAYARYEDFNKLEVAKRQVDKTLIDLKQAQQQLVQSEKMASLGELTAGIAHEIQNPLNFVNNFSEVNTELIAEMLEEVKKGNIQDAELIADDIKQNLEKINHHGKRADSIVKGMLQHSRTSSSQKELTDINALADEYLRLAYHGLRAKDKSFNAKFETDFDNTIGPIQIIPQDIGRVILNLINNAFYAVSQRQKTEGKEYEPTVVISTGKANRMVEVKVKDNGIGIQQKNLDKIFQPFFTTKPTGQGTGLGLSLAYDIVTKGHGGELKVETKEGEGSEFIINLPILFI